MRISALLLAGCIAFPAAASDPGPPRILILVDASASMATAWSGQVGDRMGAVRTTLDTLAGAFQGRKVQPEITVRIFGDQRTPNDPDACSDTRSIRPWTPADQGDLGRTLDRTQPRGAGSLAVALAAATSDLGSPTERDLVLIVLDGLDSCGGNLKEAFAALTLKGDGAEVHVFGSSLDQTDSARLSSHAKYHGVGSPAQLIQGVSLVISQRLSLPLLKESIGLTLDGTEHLPFEPAALDIVGTWTKEPIAVDLLQEKPRVNGGLGTATVTVSDSKNRQFQRLLRIPVVPEHPLNLEFFEPDAVELSIEIQASGWGRHPVLDVTWSGGPEEALQLVLQENGVPGASWFSARSISGSIGSVSMPLPAGPMELALQLRKPLGLGDGLITEVVFNSPGRSVTLEAAEGTEAGTSVGVSWDCESYPGDLVTLVPADAPPETLGTTFEAVDGSPRDFLIPFDQCSYEIRYIDGQSFEVLARITLEVTAKTAGFLASTPQDGTEIVAVRWWGPAYPLDVITLTAKDSQGADYLDWVSPADGSPARLRMPQEPGDYEIRYLTAGKDIAATLPLKIGAVAVSIDVPKTARAGGRLRVAWSGPNGPDDFLVLVRKGERFSRHLDFTYVSEGSPTSMAAPNRPGLYQVQYVATHPQRVLASATVEVLK